MVMILGGNMIFLEKGVDGNVFFFRSGTWSVLEIWALVWAWQGAVILLYIYLSLFFFSLFICSSV